MLASAERTLRAVQLLGERGRVGVSEVAAELDIAPSMAHRLVVTLCETGFARQEHPGGAYLVGPALHELALGESSAGGLRAAIAAQLPRAAKAIDETVSVVVLEGRDIRFVESIAGTQALRVAPALGETAPAALTAGGRALLAHVGDDDLERRFPTRRLPAGPAGRALPWAAFVAELDAVRRRGWAVQVGEIAPDIASVAFALRDSVGRPRAAIVATAPITRVPTLRQAAAMADALAPFVGRMQRRLRGGR